MSRICSNCRFFKRLEHQARGDCRRYAPRPDTRTTAVQWPIVAAGDWCGDWITHEDDPRPLGQIHDQDLKR